MSDSVDKTAAGATRGLFGTLSFILLMVGIEGMTHAIELPSGLPFLLILLGAACVYAAFFWESSKWILSETAQAGLGRFAQSRVTWFGMLFLVLLTIIMSPFIEQRRWPFSYPVDPAVYQANNDLKNQLAGKNTAFSAEKSLADKWRFSSGLRSSGINCQYELIWSSRVNQVASFWQELFKASGWTGNTRPAMNTPIQPGITIRTKDREHSVWCGETVQRLLSEFYPNPPSKIVSKQQTEFLNSCQPDACVQIEIDY